MTIDEALKILNIHYGYQEDFDCNSEIVTALAFGILALEKQIEAEKKPKRRIDTMTPEELYDLIQNWTSCASLEHPETELPHCDNCYMRDSCIMVGEGGCQAALVKYLYSIAESEEKK